MHINHSKSLKLSVLFAILSITSFAQSNLLDKKLDKAKDLMQNNKLDKAETYMVDLLDKNPEYGEGWDFLFSIRYKQYEESKSMDNIFNGNFTITVKDENGNASKDKQDSLTTQLADLMKNISPSKKAYNKFIFTLRKGTLLSREAYASSSYLRILNIDVEVDSNVSKKALKYFNEAEKEFGNKNYGTAALLYKHAVEEQPDFYKAQMYMGDCFYFTANYTDAVNSFKEARDRFPFLLEPRKYLTDAYGKMHIYDKAIDEAVHSLWVYPDYSMFQKMEDAAYISGLKIDIKWMQRGVLPNTYSDTSKKNINDYTDKDEIPVTKGPWKYYIEAADRIRPYCDSNGIIVKPNQLTEAKYAEQYAWEEMLKKSNDPSLDEAKKMQRFAYLDCYVLVSCFHYDLYGQYHDFVANNKDRIVEYYKTFTKSR